MTDERRTLIDLKHLIAQAQLPALPQSAIRLLEISQNPDSNTDVFAAPIEGDPGLTGQVLRFVNSSYFGFAREISTIKLAITLVGVRTIKNFALWSAVFSLMPNPRCGLLELKSLWQDSLRRALFARHFSKLLGLREADEPFSAALLQDMAVPLLAKESPDIYAKLLAAREDGRFRMSYLEREVLGWNHAEAAGVMARHWNLPESFAVLIEAHCDIEGAMQQAGTQPGRAAVALSALLPAAIDNRWTECALFETHYDKLRPANGPAVTDFLAEIDNEYGQFAPLLKLATPAKSLVEAYQETVAAAT